MINIKENTIDLYNGDCLEIIGGIPNKSIDLLLCDPPYLHVKGGCKSKRINTGVRSVDSQVLSEMSDFDKKEIYVFLNTVKPKMKVFNAYVFCSKLQIPYYLNWALENKYQFDVLIWDKMNYGFISRKFFAPNIEYIIRIYKTGLNPIDNNSQIYQKIKRYKRPKNKIHEAEKPIELLEEFVLLSSLEGQTILDCYMGSGSTGVATIKNNRRFIGIEKNSEHFNTAKERIAKFLKNNVEEENI